MLQNGNGAVISAPMIPFSFPSKKCTRQVYDIFYDSSWKKIFFDPFKSESEYNSRLLNASDMRIAGIALKQFTI